MYSARMKSKFLLILIRFFAVVCLILGFAFLCFASPCDFVATNLALSTMTDGVTPEPIPSPFDCPTCKDTGWIMHGDGHQTKCPDCDLAGLPGGIFDTIKQAKELIRKGNLLADRGKEILDAVQRDGKITVDIRLPGTSVSVSSDIIDDKKKVQIVTERPAVAGCSDGSCSATTYRYPTKKRTSWRWKR